MSNADGEVFAEGFRRLGLGKVIGMRTWGGEIWLSSSNVLVDNGIATAAEFGVYGPEGRSLIEGHGAIPTSSSTTRRGPPSTVTTRSSTRRSVTFRRRSAASRRQRAATAGAPAGVSVL